VRGHARGRGTGGLMSLLGQSRRFGPPSMTSGFPPKADTVTDGRHVSKVPQADVKRHAITCATLNDIGRSLLDEVSDDRHGACRCIGDCRQ
jgi:hypothetical protein